MKKYLYLINKLKIQAWIKYWLLNKSALPEGYKKIDFLSLASDGKVINTQIIGDSEWEIIAQATSQPNRNQVLISRALNRGHWCGASGIYWGFGSTNYLEYDTLEMTKLLINFGTLESTLTINDETINVSVDGSSVSSFKLGSTNTNRGFIGKIYSAKCWQNDILVRDFIPCRKIETSQEGLFDLINNEFYVLE